METRFTSLRIIGTIWKFLAWMWLIAGILASIAFLVMSVRTGFRGWLSLRGQVPWLPPISGLVGGIVVFGASLAVVLVYFLALYAVGDLISLLLAIEENTRETTLWLRSWSTAAAQATAAQPTATTPQPPPA